MSEPTWSEMHEFAIQQQIILSDRVYELSMKLIAKQAQIDALMLEYCPDEMTKEQLANWESHQRCAP